jgi:phosphoribosylformylglycinamidine (FGAM) synthase PurS component
MSYIRLFVTLKITDNIARSAMYTLKSRLGFPAVMGLVRSDLWEFSFPGLSSQQARQITERLVQKTALFVNPNKHSYRIETADAALSSESKIPLRGDVSSCVLVCDRIDGKAEETLEACLSLTDGDEQPAALTRGVWWELTFDGLSEEQIKQSTEMIAVTKSRTEGLLANPHYQTHQIFCP